MESSLGDLVDVSIKVEESLNELYKRFGELFPEDVELWNSLSLEEQNHIQMLSETRKPFINGLFVNRLHDLKEIYKVVRHKLNFYKKLKKADKAQAFEDAIELETIRSRTHLDIARIKRIGKRTLRTFLFLNRRERNNAIRIKKHILNIRIKTAAATA
ncbi:MAG TPA: hypothetical protein QF753_04570 [Victivallales bacterium]|nr:hypothetical protein [Victivallales bacterium]